MFMSNAGRFYVDCGLHPEMATPECCSPVDVVRYTLAGRRILERLAVEVAASDSRIDEIVISGCNVDYSGTNATWGCHESYLHTADPELLRNQVVPHLASRIIYTGAGGLDLRSRGIVYTLSPRVVAHIVCETSGSSTGHRGIWHTKDEPLCGRAFTFSAERTCIRKPPSTSRSELPPS
jgi:hypothetical protein